MSSALLASRIECRRPPLPACRCYSPAERRTDAVIHILGVLLAAAGASVLLSSSDQGGRLGLYVYCFGLLAMVTSSALYNLAPGGTAKERLRQLDHAAIFLMIAGTLTPFLLGRLAFGTVFLVLTWLWAAGGVMVKLAWPRRFERVSVALYVLIPWLGCAAIVAPPRLIAPGNLALFIAGGLLYSIGVVFHRVERIPFHTAIWHALVLTAAGLHFAVVAAEFAP